MKLKFKFHLHFSLVMELDKVKLSLLHSLPNWNRQ